MDHPEGVRRTQLKLPLIISFLRCAWSREQAQGHRTRINRKIQT